MGDSSRRCVFKCVNDDGVVDLHVDNLLDMVVKRRELERSDDNKWIGANGVVGPGSDNMLKFRSDDTFLTVVGNSDADRGMLFQVGEVNEGQLVYVAKAVLARHD